MKKMLFAAAAMIAAMTVNAQTACNATFFSGATLTFSADGKDASVVAATTNPKLNGTEVDYVAMNSGEKGYVVFNDNFSMNYYTSKAKAGIIKTTTTDVDGVDTEALCANGKGVVMCFQVNPNSVVTLKVAMKGLKEASPAYPTFEVSKGTADAENHVFTMADVLTWKEDGKPEGERNGNTFKVYDLKFTADANGKLEIKETANGFNLFSYTASTDAVAGKYVSGSLKNATATAANDAEADAEFAYSVKINGQKVNAKVYNEPVIEVSSNGSAKVVINKK